MSEKAVHTSIHFYALLISFATLLCMIITLGVALYDIVQVVVPEFTCVPPTSYDYEKNRQVIEKTTPVDIQLEKMNGARSLTRGSFILLIDVVLFLYHWRLANRPVRRLVTV